jgi:uncharacterized protein DUF5658
MVTRFLWRGRRQAGRRGSEQLHIYVDRPAPCVVGAFAIIMALSAADAYFTVTSVTDVTHEINPLMRTALAFGLFAFAAIKLSLTFVPAAFLCLHGTWTLARAGLLSTVVVYVFILVYHLHGHAGVIQAFLGTETSATVQ